MKHSKWVWLAPIITILTSLAVSAFLRANDTARETLASIAVQTPDIATGGYVYGVLIAASIVGVGLYFYIDYLQHARPFKLDAPDIKYGFLHHASVVIVPRAKYGWRHAAYWTGYGLATFLLLSLVLAQNIAPVLAFAPDEFVTTWRTDNPGVTSSNQIRIPTTGIGYNYNVTWEEVGNEANNGVAGPFTGSGTITFPSAGTYEIRITGAFPRIYFNNSGDRQKILTVEQWGSNAWTSMERAFYGASNLRIPAIDAPNLSAVSSLDWMFKFATSFNDPLNHWDVSSATRINEMFYGASSFNQPLNSWNVSNVTEMYTVFYGATSFNQNINTWAVNNATVTFGMFSNATSFNQPLDNWNVAGVTNMQFMFDEASSFDQSLGNWNMSSVTSAEGMLNQSGMSIEKYDATLQGWSSQTLSTGVSLGALSLIFCNAAAERQSIISNYSWSFSGDAEDCGEFVTTWKTDNVGVTGSNQIRIPTTGIGYNYNVEWEQVGNPGNNGSVGPFTGDATITFPFAGTYQVSISGDFPRIYFAGTGDRRKILTVEQWGSNQWTSMAFAFSRAQNLTIQAADSPDLSQVTSMNAMFYEATSLNQPLNNWNVSNVTDMGEMLFGATNFNQPLNNWNVSSVTNMNFMLSGAATFNQSLASWDTSSLQTANFMLENASLFNQSLASWNVTQLTGAPDMLKNTSLSIDNYDATLTSWASQVLQNNVIFGAEPTKYCNAAFDRQAIISTYNWTISDGGNNCNPFITTWKTDNIGYGSSGANQVTIPTTGGGYNYTVDWGDGNIDTGVTGNITHTYAVPGTYTVSIFGDFPRIYCFSNNPGGWDCYHKLLTVEQWGDIAWSSMNQAFSGAQNLRINAADSPDLSNVSDMSYMFSQATAMNDNISSWDTSAIQNMAGVFSSAFSYNQSIDAWDTSSVTNMRSMFFGAFAYNQPLNSWDTSSVTNMSAMFLAASSFNQPLNNWNTSGVLSMDRMFEGADAFDQPLNSWNVGSVTNMNSMFKQTDVFNQDLNSWDTSNVTDMGDMFYLNSVFNGDISSWNVGQVQDMGSMFYSASAFDQNLNGWNTSSVTDMSTMFASASLFNQPLDQWDTGNVTTMSSMFSQATNFNQNINTWDTSSVQSMGSMFSYSSFNQPLNLWDTSSVTNMSSMFSGTPFNQNIESWDTSNVYYMQSMFSNNTVFNQPLGSWDVSGVAKMRYMFSGASSFNQPLGSWNITGLDATHEAVDRMFYNATSFNQDLSTWNTSGLTRAYQMFSGATSFNQSLAAWDVSGITYMPDILSSTAMSTVNYDATLTAWSQQSLQSDVPFGSSAFYCLSADQRADIISTYSWTISDAGEDCGEYDPPTVATSAASNVTSEQATLNGDVTADGGAGITNAGFQWGETTGYGQSVSGLASGIGAYSTAIALATCGQTYHYRAFATNPIGTTYGSDQTFTTDTCFKEAVTQTPVDLGESTIQMVGTVNGEAAGDFTSGGFEWGPTTSYGSTIEDLGINSGTFRFNISVTCGSQYNYRAFAEEAGDILSYGQNKTFTVACPATESTTNTAPVVLITAPEPNKSFPLGSVLTISADADDTDGTVSKVDFYVAGVLIDTDTTEPYSVTGDLTNEGVFEITAVATDNDGAQTASTPVEFIVTPESSESDEEYTGLVLTPDERDIYPDGKLKDIRNYVVSGVPAQIGRSLPWSILLVIAGAYIVQAGRQLQQKNKLTALARATAQTHANLTGFLDIVSHYLGTAATTISGAVQLLVSKIPAGVAATSVASLNADSQKVSTSVNGVIAGLQDESKELTGQITQTESSIAKLSRIRWVAAPIAVGAALLVASSTVLASFGIWQASTGDIIFNTIMYAGTAFLVFVSFELWQGQHRARLVAQSAHHQQEKLLQTKLQFISESQPALASDATIMQKYATAIDEPHFTKLLNSGINRLSGVASAFGRLGAFMGASASTERVSIDTQITSLLESYEQQAQDKNIQLKTEIQPGLFSTLSQPELEQVIQTLVSNALEFTEPEGTIIVGARTVGKKLEIRVKDTGLGIDAKKQELLMQPFVRATDTKEYAHEGLGMNLYITRIIAENHGGSVHIKSKVDSGTTVTFKIPSV